MGGRGGSGPSSTNDLAPVDQFHIGGKRVTLELLELPGAERGARVVDLGGGLGGPARTLAATYGCRVAVLDLTEEFCRVGRLLTSRTGHAGLVTFAAGDANRAPFPDGTFDLAWTQHAQMNVAAKDELFAEVRRILRPGGRFAFHEIMAGANQPPVFPVPWAAGPSLSFLRAPGELRKLVEAAGFRALAWRDVTDASTDLWSERLEAARSGSPLGVHLLLGPAAPEIAGNTMRNLAEGRIRVIQAVFDRM